MTVTPVNKLKILLIESHLGARSHVKGLLRQLGYQNITVAKNGAEALTNHTQFSFDLLILDFDIDNCFSGTEFIRYLMSRDLLPTHCRVLFITDKADKINQDLPFRLLNTEVLQKPLNKNHISHLLENYSSCNSRFKILFNQLQKADKNQQLKVLQQMNFVGLDQSQQNEISLIKANQLLELGHTKEAAATLKTINNMEQQTAAQAGLYYLIGNENQFKLAILKKQSLGILSRKKALFEIAYAFNNKHFIDALAIINKFEEHTYSPQEVELKALILFEIDDFHAASEYLQQKLGTTLENQHYRNRVSLSWLKIVLLDFILLDHADEKQNSDFIANYQMAFSSIQFKGAHKEIQQYHNYVKKILEIIQLNANPKTAQLNAMLHNADDPNKKFFMACIYSLLQQDKNVMTVFQSKIKILNHLDHSAKSISLNYLTTRLLTKACKTPDLMATFLNRSGLMHQNDNQSFISLNDFYHAHQLMPENIVYILNLLNVMQKLKIKKYWQYSQQDLITFASQLKLNSEQKQRLEQITMNQKITQYSE